MAYIIKPGGRALLPSLEEKEGRLPQKEDKRRKKETRNPVPEQLVFPCLPTKPSQEGRKKGG